MRTKYPLWQLSIWLFTAFLLTYATASGRIQNGPGEFTPDELVCKMQPGYSIQVVNDLFETQVKGNQAQTGCYLLQTPDGMDPESLAVAISALPEVLYCGPNYYLDAPEPFQRSQPFLDQQAIGEYQLQAAAVTLDLAAVHLVSDGSLVKVAVIDGGVNLTHPEFLAKDGGVVSGWDYVDNDSIANDEPGGSGSGHGTFVAGIVKLTAPGAEIHAYRVLDTTGRGDGYTISDAMLKAVDDGCKVINLSLGMVGRTDVLDDALRYAEKSNVIVVAACGNDSTDTNYLFPFPASRSNCIAVAALDSFNILADFSNYGEKVNVCAPGTQIYSTYLDTLYAWWDGTSFASPFVAGTAALFFSADSSITAEQMDTIVTRTSVNVDSLNPGLEGELGAGLIDPLAALSYVTDFHCGDADRNGVINISDAIYLISYIFAGGLAPLPMSSGDADCSGYINVSDAVHLINFIFGGSMSACPGCP